MGRDAEDAVRQRDGYNYDGYTLRVEFPRGSGMARGRGRGGGGRGGPPSRRSENRVLVSGELQLQSLPDMNNDFAAMVSCSGLFLSVVKYRS